MKSIVVCLDGTNQTKSQQYPTNIARIFDSLGGAPIDADHGSLETTAAGPPMVLGKYLPGVGTEGDMALKILGNLFGDGIAEPIVRAYTFLSRNYDPNDEIFITGFSRGATAARALAGFVTHHGLLDRTKYDVSDKNAAYLRAISAWYAYRDERPNLANQARLVVIEGLLGQGIGLPKLEPSDFIAPPPIKVVGVFDTVSSLGLPHLDHNGDAVFDFSICDTTLGAGVEFGFHALAADEMRDLFSPTYWTAREQIVQQIFPGCHSDVGGGYPHRGLSDAVLTWMFQNFASVGLNCDASRLNPPLTADPLAPAQDDGATFPFKNTPLRSRAFPDTARLSDSLNARWEQATEMLPITQVKPYKAKGTYADGRPLRT
jgi:uncharacterized protein (DUF2235 family)